MALQEQTQTQSNTAAWSVNLPRIDFVLFAIVAALLVIGLIMIWSVTFSLRVSLGVDQPEATFIKQLQYTVIGLVMLGILAFINYRIWQKLSIVLMVITVLGLAIMLLLPLDETYGARRWLFGSSVQPGEIAKFTVIVYMAAWLSSKGDKLRQVTYGLIPFAVLVGVVVGLIVLQPNMSTAIIIGLCAMAMFFIAGADLVQYFLLMLGGGLAMLIVIFRTPYQNGRLATFLIGDPLSNVTKETYQIAEALTALGSGGLVGRGIGTGYSKFGYVPAPHTDSIFALLGEEMGLIGTWAVIALFLALAYRGFRIASRTNDPFGQVLASGLTFWIIFQAFVNIEVVTATMPFTGVPLPFISFGGSSLISVLVAVGVLLSISRGEPAPKPSNATFNFGWRDRGTRVPSTDRRRLNSQTSTIRRTRRPRQS